MVDYTKSTGSAGTLIIRDDGVNITFLLACSDPATNISSPGATWAGFRNAANVSGRFTWPSGGGTRVIAGPWAVNTSQTVTFAIGATGTSGLGGATSLSVSINRALPAAPSGLSIVRGSDTQHTLNWSRNATYTSVLVQRRRDGGSWQQIGAPTGNAFTFTDKTTTADHKYDYRVAGKNAAGQSAWSGIGTVYTTPAPPTHLIATRSGNNILLDTRFTEDQTAYVDYYQVFDNGTLIANNVPEILPWTHVAPNSTTPHTYTMKAVKSGLVGPLSTPSNTVQLLTAPNAPTGLTPNGAVRAGDADVRFGWTHNPVDSSAQAAYELRYRVAGTTTWTTLTGTTAKVRDITLAVGSWEWQARTKGSHPDFSPWSATATVAVIDRPGVAVIRPETEWDASVLPVEWSWLQDQGRPQSAWQVELLNAAGDTIESRSGTGAATTLTLAYRLTEGEWTVRVRAATGDVWSEWAAAAFTVTFDPPATPAIEGIWDESQGGVQLTATPSDDAGFVPTAFVRVERSIDDGDTWELVIETPQEALTVDWESLSYGQTRYRATAVTSEGATASVEIMVEADSPALWLSGGDGFGVTGRLPFDPAVKISAGRQRALKQYAGRSNPVALSGEALTRVVTVSGTTSDRDDETADVESLTRLAQVEAALFLFRDPDGRRIYGMVTEIPLSRESSTVHPEGWEGVWGYSFTLTEAT